MGAGVILIVCHLQATLLDIPQPEELPSEANLLTPDDQDKYLGQLEPYLAWLGYRPTTWGEWLEFNALQTEDDLLSMWRDEVISKNPSSPKGESGDTASFVLHGLNERLRVHRTLHAARSKAGHNRRDSPSKTGTRTRITLHLWLWTFRGNHGGELFRCSVESFLNTYVDFAGSRASTISARPNLCSLLHAPGQCRRDALGYSS